MGVANTYVPGSWTRLGMGMVVYSHTLVTAHCPSVRMALIQELDEFLAEVETVLSDLPSRFGNPDMDTDRVLLSAEWLL